MSALPLCFLHTQRTGKTLSWDPDRHGGGGGGKLLSVRAQRKTFLHFFHSFHDWRFEVFWGLCQLQPCVMICPLPASSGSVFWIPHPNVLSSSLQVNRLLKVCAQNISNENRSRDMMNIEQGCLSRLLRGQNLKHAKGPERNRINLYWTKLNF